MVQGKPVEKLDETKIFVDGIEIVESGTYNFGNKVVISQNYYIANPSSILSAVQNLHGTFTTHPIFYNLTGVEFCAKLNISYIFTDASHCFVVQTLSYLQNQKLGYFGFIQSGAISDTEQTKLYIPKALQVGTFDFRTNPVYNSTTHTTSLDITSEYWENELLPPDRWIMNDSNIAFNAGYLFDYGVGGNNRKDNIGNAFFLYTSRKMYPHGIDGMKLGNVSGGSSYSSVAYRIYKPSSEFEQNGKRMINCFEFNDKYYMYLDFSAVGNYEIEIPQKYIGKTVEIFEKSSNVNLLTPITSNSILVSVSTSNPMYGYMVAQIKLNN